MWNVDFSRDQMLHFCKSSSQTTSPIPCTSHPRTPRIRRLALNTSQGQSSMIQKVYSMLTLQGSPWPQDSVVSCKYFLALIAFCKVTTSSLVNRSRQICTSSCIYSWMFVQSCHTFIPIISSCFLPCDGNYYVWLRLLLSEGFLEKNRDTFSADLVNLVAKSKSSFLLEIFAKERSMVSPQNRTYFSLYLPNDFLSSFPIFQEKLKIPMLIFCMLFFFIHATDIFFHRAKKLAKDRPHWANSSRNHSTC